jgi:CRISPR/Cas system CMR-associated protein Cmr1 (group 7 of RAMP superfamily)
MFRRCSRITVSISEFSDRIIWKCAISSNVHIFEKSIDEIVLGKQNSLYLDDNIWEHLVNYKL